MFHLVQPASAVGAASTTLANWTGWKRGGLPDAALARPLRAGDSRLANGRRDLAIRFFPATAAM